MAIRKKERILLNELLTKLEWGPDPYMRLVELGVGETVMLRLLQVLRREARAQAQQRLDEAAAEVERLKGD